MDLLHAAELGQLDEIQRLVEQEANLDVKDNNGYTPLIHAACEGHLDVVRCLLEAKANLEARNKQGNALYHATVGRRWNVVQYLVKEAHAYLETKDSDGHTSLVQAVNYSAPRDVIQCLVEAKANLEAKDKSGNTALSLSCSVEGDNFEVVKYLVKEAHANLETRNKDDRTPLMNALFHECHTIAIDVIQCLLKAKANLEAKSSWGDTALSIAAKELDGFDGYGLLSSDEVDDRADVVECLVKARANLDTKDNDGMTPLMCASERGLCDFVRCLLESRANVEAKNANSETAMTLGCFEVGQLLHEEQTRLDVRCEKVRQQYAERIIHSIRKHLPRLAMLHSEVEKAVFPLPRDMVKLEVDRLDQLDLAKHYALLERIEARNWLYNKRKREEELRTYREELRTYRDEQIKRPKSRQK